MKTKNGFNLRNVCGEHIVVAEGKENIERFSGWTSYFGQRSWTNRKSGCPVRSIGI